MLDVSQAERCLSAAESTNVVSILVIVLYVIANILLACFLDKKHEKNPKFDSSNLLPLSVVTGLVSLVIVALGVLNVSSLCTTSVPA